MKRLVASLTARRSLLLAAVILLAAAWTGPARAGDYQYQVFSLKDCIELALERSPDYKSALEGVEGARWQKKQAFTGYLPAFQVDYSYTRLDTEPWGTTTVLTGISPLGVPEFEKRKYQAGTEDNFSLVGKVTQPIFTGFALLSQNEIAALGLNLAEIERERARLDLILQVKQAYYNVLQAGKNLDVAEQSVRQLEAHLNVARNFYDVGMEPKNHVLEADVRLAQAVQTRTQAENNLLLTKAALNTLMRRDLEDHLEIEDILSHKPFVHTLPQCFEAAGENRPEIKAAEERIKVAGQQVRLAKSDYYPTVSMVYQYTKAGEDWEVDGDDYHDPSAWALTAVASWKVFEWGRTRDEVQVKRVQENQAKLTLTKINDGVRLEVKQNYLNLEAAEKNIFVAQKAVLQAEENYRMSEERYREQVTTSTEVTDAETLLTQARSSYYYSLYQFNLAWANLERAMGLDWGSYQASGGEE